MACTALKLSQAPLSVFFTTESLLCVPSLPTLCCSLSVFEMMPSASKVPQSCHICPFLFIAASIYSWKQLLPKNGVLNDTGAGPSYVRYPGFGLPASPVCLFAFVFQQGLLVHWGCFPVASVGLLDPLESQEEQTGTQRAEFLQHFLLDSFL